ncbi:MAG: PfkB family carbohydrate kinase [Planctomycetota bacterium]|nr:PfkB family carbohydrate kinase [Planctomycetota bacterium]
MSLIVTGSIGIDSVEAPTGTAENVLGGSSIYFAAAASFFGPVRLVGAVGDDFPDAFLKTFKHFNVDLAGLERRAGSKTFRWRGKYHENMNLRDTLDVQLNVLGERLPTVPASYRDSRFVFLANTHPAGQLELLNSFPKRTLAVADTMDLWISTQRSTLLELFKKIDGLVLNDSEAQMLTGETNLIRAGEAVRALGPKFVVIKKGEHGSLLLSKEGTLALPAYPARDVVDPTGAGDSFAGGMMGSLSATGDLSLAGLRKAMAYGTVVASYNIEAFSLNRMMQIGRPDLDRRVAEYSAMLRVG